MGHFPIFYNKGQKDSRVATNGGPMATPLDPKQIVSFEELLMSQVVQQEALTGLLVEKGIFTQEELLEMVNVVDKEMKKRKRRD
jgi:hypothetical protein